MSNEELIEIYREICISLKSDIRLYTELYDAKVRTLTVNLDIINADNDVNTEYDSAMIKREYVNSLLTEIKNTVTSRLGVNDAILGDLIIVRAMLHNLKDVCIKCHTAWVIAYHTMIEIEEMLRLIITTGHSIKNYLDEIDSLIE